MARVLEIRDLHYRYPEGIEALKGVSFEVDEGESVGVVGPNGAGKSTLLLHLNGILTGYSSNGSDPVWVKGIPVRKETLRQIRRLVGLVFQDPNDQLFSPTVFEDVAFGPLNLGLSPEEVAERVKKALEAVGMTGYESRSPHHLSLGEKKKVAIATVLAMAPEILVLDEPTANLDPVGRWELMELLRSLPHTKVIASHDLDFVERTCNKVVILNAGKVLTVGPVDQILKDRALLVKARLAPRL
ncbi:MAG: energy-coupling factor ABC transporter ATP-binding protein [Anaerolineae bacterium]|nr:energy-coupling factor ABC transporter ATP-binding protein [Anaerolineae bacterium]